MRILTNDTDFYSGFDAMVYNHGYEECLPGHSYGPGKRRSYMLHYITSGKGIFRCGSREWHLQKGDLFFIPPGVEVYYEADPKDPWGYGWIGLQGSKIHEYLARTSLLENPVIHYDQDEELSLIYIRIARAYQGDPALRDILLNRCLYELLIFLIEHFPSSASSDKEHSERLIAQIMSYCLMRIDSPVTVDEIAAAFHLNRSTLSRLFSQKAGLPLKQYIWKIKEEEACRLLASTSYSIETVAHSVGYSDPLYFSRIFHQKVGLSPSAYRQAHS